LKCTAYCRNNVDVGAASCSRVQIYLKESCFDKQCCGKSLCCNVLLKLLEMDFMLTAKVIVFSTYKSRMTPNNIRYLNYRPFRGGQRKVPYLIKFSRHFNFAYLSKFANLAKLNITRNFYDLQYPFSLDI